MLAAKELTKEGIAKEQVQADDAIAAAVEETVAEDGAEFPTHLFQQVLDTCSAVTRRVENLEHDKATQKLEIIKLKARDKGKGILSENLKPMKKKDQIELEVEYARKLHEEINKDIYWDAAIDHVKQKSKENPQYIKRYQVMKKRPQTKSQAHKNIMIYLKNTAGYKLDFFKGMSYDEIRLIFQARWKLLTSCGVHIIILSTIQLILLVGRRYPLSKFTLERLPLELMLSKRSRKNTKCVNAADEELTAAKHKLMTVDYVAEGRLRKMSAEKAWATIEELARYEDKGWNDPTFSK
nr:hypothetical protein [Tanacetum cinerariifolium]